MCNKNPLVSVVISCYNFEKYLEEAIQSIIDQTYKNLEILITDDCSTDNTSNILVKLAAKDHRIILFKNEQNLKLPKSLNNMIAIAKGKYIARMDADDIAIPERIEKQVVWMETHPDYSICGTNGWQILENGKKFRRSYLPLTNEEINIAKYFKCPFIHVSIMMKKDVAIDNQYNEKFFAGQDYELWFRILNKHKGFNLKERLMMYRVLPAYLSDKLSNKYKKEDREKLLEEMFMMNLTENNASLARKYVQTFFVIDIDNTEKIDTNDDLYILLLGLFSKINNCNGYNFYILLRFFRFYHNNGKLIVFLQHLSVKNNIIFFIRFAWYMFGRVISSIIKLLQ